jgi:hypothetical protein
VKKRQTDGGEIVEDLLFHISFRACLRGGGFFMLIPRLVR